MTEARSPAHATLFVRPVDSPDIYSKGSEGAGARLSLGARAVVHERTGGTRVFIDGEESEARVTRRALELAAPGMAFEAHIENDLPVGQGFGMSAAGAVAAALCAAELSGRGRREAFLAAHAADIEGGGGLGDVAGIMCEAHQPTRVSAGIPGRAVDRGISLPVASVAVLGPKVSTAAALGDARRHGLFRERGAEALAAFMSAPASIDSLFDAANAFSSSSGAESAEVSEAIGRLRRLGVRSAACLLGSSVIALAPAGEVEGALGVPAIPAPTTAEPARVTRRA
ncbi:MAG: pantothenate kinase [Candidatus Methanoplasma sp.]|jgi:pantoate kinase|nr:pantothenate kinase [Candidatus Methanoplasma sp.]